MTEDRDQLRHALRGRLSGSAGEAAWAGLRDAGVLGLRVPETLGGLGLEAGDLEPVFDVLGTLCLPTPYLETNVVAAGLLSRLRGDRTDDLLVRISKGARVAVAGVEPGLTAGVRATASGEDWRLTGRLSVVLGGLDAEVLLVLADVEGAPALFRIASEALIGRRAVPTIDGRMAADIDLDRAPALRLTGDIVGALEAVRDEAAAAICIEAAALCRRLAAETTDYAKQRRQFGQPLSGFQVVRHRLVDMNIQARRLTAIARRAIAALQDKPAERARIVSAAKVTAARVGRRVGQDAVQLHGGMGMTEELPIGRMFKRLTVIESELGSADFHLDRYRGAQTAA
jgi:alkylation response protein AidB-like acyl-CoA dehydrogenase